MGSSELGYSIIIWLPVIAVALLLGLVGLGLASRDSAPLPWIIVLCIAPLVAATAICPEALRASRSAFKSQQVQTRDGWDRQVGTGHGQWYASAAAGAYVGWCLIRNPIVFVQRDLDHETILPMGNVRDLSRTNLGADGEA